MTQPGSPQSSFGGAAGRGLALIVFAVVIGLGLLHSTVDRGAATVVAAPDLTTTTVASPGETSDTTTATTDGQTPDTTDGTVSDTTIDTAIVSTDLVDRNLLKVIVVNAKTGVNGAAGRTTTEIGGIGYTTVDPANGTGDELEDSIIYFALGSRREANRLANDLGWSLDFVQERPSVVPAEPFPADSSEWPDLIVMLGKNQAAAG